MTRIAANDAAEHASIWAVSGDATGEKAKYQAKVKNDARLINCQLPNPLPEPVLGAGTELGAPVTVSLSCQFGIITPVISNIIGSTILVSAETTYPVKEGVVATVPGGGAPILPAPVAKFEGTPQSGWSGLSVTFNNQSTGAPSSQTWDFSVNASGTGTGSVNPAVSLTSGPQTAVYTCTGTPGQTCTFGVTLSVANAGGSDVETKLDYITVTVPPLPVDPMAEFTGTPRTGVEPQTVTFTVVPKNTPPVVYTQYQWDFNGDGVFDASGATTTHVYPTDGAYDVTLKVTSSTGATSTLTKKAYIIITNKICIVPDFGNTKKNQAQAKWTAAGFTTSVQYQAGQNNYTINYQSITGGTIDPLPDGCASIITVGP
jgi:PKD repeat protein